MKSLEVNRLPKDVSDTPVRRRKKSIFFDSWPLIVFTLTVIFFFWKFIIIGLIPIPADTIVGMYHPWRDIIWDNFAAGVPFKNFLITDPVRQLYPWRQLAIDLVRKGHLPLWNPYTATGSPLLANFQSAVFYPLNILFFFLPFSLSWGGLIILQPLLAGFFLFSYLRHLKLTKAASLLGALSFSFSGFFIAWLEWGNILHTALWLPLILLSIEKTIEKIVEKKLLFAKRLLVAIRRCIAMKWSLILVGALSFQFFAGHLQTSFYLILFSIFYLVWRLFQVKKNRLRLSLVFAVWYLVFGILTAVQWAPTLRFIQLSARKVDQVGWQKPGWFIPWRHLVQFMAPDFFGNPTTLNYWGEWNYAEFVGFIGVIPLIFACMGLWGFWSCHRVKEVRFFSFTGMAALSLALPTPWAKIPYQLGIPLLSTSQPTRLLFPVVFCLAVLAAYGLDRLIEWFGSKKRDFGVFRILGFFGALYVSLWSFVFLAPKFWAGASWISGLAVSRRNLILPTGMIIAFFGLVLSDRLARKFYSKNKILIRNLEFVILSVFLGLTIFDLFRFGNKFTPFVKKDWLFPTTQAIKFLKSDKEVFRFMSVDNRIFPPNFSLAYRLQTIDSYDPLYLRRFGELVAAMERRKPNIDPPFGFNRIITPQNYQSPLIDLLNVKYVLSLTDLKSPKLDLVFQEGETRVYQNKKVFPRVFMVYDYKVARDRQEAIEILMSSNIDLSRVAIFEEKPVNKIFEPGENIVKITNYQENKIVVHVETDKQGILILSDSYYPGWKAKIESQKTKIYRANYNFRGVFVPEGSYEVNFTMESF